MAHKRYNINVYVPFWDLCETNLISQNSPGRVFFHGRPDQVRGI